MGKFPLSVRRLTNEERALYYERILKESMHGIELDLVEEEIAEVTQIED